MNSPNFNNFKTPAALSSAEGVMFLMYDLAQRLPKIPSFSFPSFSFGGSSLSSKAVTALSGASLNVAAAPVPVPALLMLPVPTIAPTPIPTLLEPTYLESITGLASEYTAKGMGLVAGGREILSQNLFTINLLDVAVDEGFAGVGIQSIPVSVGTTLAVTAVAVVIAVVAYKILAPTKSTNPMEGSFQALKIRGFEQKV